MTEPTPQIPGIPFGEYRLLKRLGTGGMAEVFLAVLAGPAGFTKHLVIKRILPHLAANRHFVDMFLREARLAASVDHPNLVHVSAFGEIQGEYYIAMEYVEGFTLSEILKRTGTLTPGVACRLAVDVLEALHAVHHAKDGKGRALDLVHRDVSPGNIMVTRDGAVKLLDFGIAVARDDRAAITMGTQRYTAPEILRGEPVDHRADLFAVGVLMFGMISGNLPFEDEETAEHVPLKPNVIPEKLWPAVAAALAPRPEHRIASARALQSSLELFLISRGIEGTRSHLADILQAVLPPTSPRGAVLSRLTRQLSRFTRSVISHPSPSVSEVSSTSPVPRRGTAAALLLGVLLLGAASVFAWRMVAFQSPKTSEVMSIPAQTSAKTSTVAPSGEDRSAPPPKSVVPSSAEAPVEPAKPPKTEVAPVVERAAKPARNRRARREPGRLTIDTRPWSEVYLGSRRLGMTPLVGVRLPSGEHRLTLKNAALKLERTITVRIRAGKVTRIRRTL